ncbi:MAG: four helix bundle protein [Mongoliitalea sp.]
MENVILNKTKEFAAKILNCYFFLQTKHHYRLSEQLVGAGTSIGANVVEAQAAQSKKDFISKMSIAAKEARETEYWLDLMAIPELLLNHDDFKFLQKEIIEIIRILDSIIISTKKNMNKDSRI